MKKIVVFLILLLFIGIAKAEINLNSLESERYNLGESVVLKGYVQDSKPIYGTLEINSVCGNETNPIYFSVIGIDPKERYDILQKIPIKESMMGTCFFKLQIKDGGEIKEEVNSGDFEVTKELRIEGETNVLTQKPGEEVIINGIIRKSNGLRVNSGSVVLTLNNKIYASGLSNGAFSYIFNLPEDIGSGEQIISIKARDLEGNEGVKEVKFKVISMPEGLSIELDRDAYNPGDRILAVVYLNDQSGRNIVGSSTVQLLDPKGDEELTRVVDNGNEFEMFLSDLSLPGTWMLEAKNKDLFTDKRFYVEEVKNKKMELKDNKLIVTNIGNVNFEEPIQIDLKNENGEEFSVIKKTSLKPNQTIVIDLDGEVPSGTYDIGMGGVTGNVVVEGNGFSNLRNSSYLGYVALVFVFLFLIFVVMSKGRRRLSKREKAKKEGKKILDFSSKKIQKEVKPPEMKVKKEDIDFLVNKVKGNFKKDTAEDNSSRNKAFDIFD